MLSVVLPTVLVLTLNVPSRAPAPLPVLHPTPIRVVEVPGDFEIGSDDETYFRFTCYRDHSYHCWIYPYAYKGRWTLDGNRLRIVEWYDYPPNIIPYVTPECRWYIDLRRGKMGLIRSGYVVVFEPD